jgi:hypothetical protein
MSAARRLKRFVFELHLRQAQVKKTNCKLGKPPLKVRKELDLHMLINGVLLLNDPLQSHDANAEVFGSFRAAICYTCDIFPLDLTPHQPSIGFKA